MDLEVIIRLLNDKIPTTNMGNTDLSKNFDIGHLTPFIGN